MLMQVPIENSVVNPVGWKQKQIIQHIYTLRKITFIQEIMIYRITTPTNYKYNKIKLIQKQVNG